MLFLMYSVLLFFILLRINIMEHRQQYFERQRTEGKRHTFNLLENQNVSEN